MSRTEPSRVYTIVHYHSPVDGSMRFLLGIESVLHRKALAEMRERLGAPGRGASHQRGVMRALLAAGEPVLGAGGSVRAHGPFAGLNFGGVLLIGRPALAGGRVERTDPTPEHAALRELVEEMRLPLELLDVAELRTAALMRLVPLGDIERPRRPNATGAPVIERYFSLDLDALRSDIGRAGDMLSPTADLLSPAAILAEFFSDEFESELDAERAEKRGMLDLSPDEFVAELAGPLRERDRAEIRAEVGKLRNHLAVALFCDVPDSFVDELVEFQASRRLDNQAEMARRFVLRRTVSYLPE